MSIIRKTLYSASLGSLLLLGIATQADSLTASKYVQSEPGTQSQKQAVKSVSGKVATIGSGGTAFTLDVSGGDEKKTMDFVVDKNTQVKGQVRQGTPVTVEYQAMETGQYLAVSITAQA